MSALESFEKALAGFTHGDRYNKYLAVVRRGLNAGIDPEGLVEKIMEDAPDPKPNRHKILEALNYALANDRGDAERGEASLLSAEDRAEIRRQSLDPRVRSFVATLRELGKGATSASLGELSEVPIPKDYASQAAAQLATLGADWRYMTWAGQIVDSKTAERLGRQPKTPIPPWFTAKYYADERKRLEEQNKFTAAHELEDKQAAGLADPHDLGLRLKGNDPAVWPSHISLCPLSGMKSKTSKGKWSYDCETAVGILSHALLEFDDLKTEEGMPDRAAVEIVAGLVKWSAEHDGLFKPLSCVWTGSKSLHTVLRVRLPPRRIPGTAEYDPLTTDYTTDDDRKFYEEQARQFRDLFASADDPRFRADPGGVNPSMHTRLAGGVNLKTGRRARLLYLAAPSDDDRLF